MEGWAWDLGWPAWSGSVAGPGLSGASAASPRTLQLDGTAEDSLDLPRPGLADSSAELSCDSRANSDYETDGEGWTDGKGGPHTDAEEGPRAPALARSSEPVQVDEPQSPRDPGAIPAHREPQVSRAQVGPGKGPGTGGLDTGREWAERPQPDQLWALRCGVFEPLGELRGKDRRWRQDSQGHQAKALRARAGLDWHQVCTPAG